ncbi:MAG: MFS transporter [Candidatus Syntropharchaeales archaeon]
MRSRKNHELLFNVFLFSIAIFLFALAQGIITAVYPSYLESFVQKAYIVGVFASIVYIVQLPISAPVGALSDIFGRKKLLIGSLTSFALVEVFYYLNENLIFLTLLQLVIGVLMITIFVTAEAFIRDVSPPEMRGRVRSFYGTWITAGYLFGPIVGGWIGDNYSIRLPFLVSAVLILSSLLFLIDVKDGDRVLVPDKPMKKKISFIKPLKRFLSLGGGVRYLSINAIVLYFWYATKWIYGPLYLLYLGFDLNIVGLWLAASLLPLIIFQIPAGMFGDRIGKDRVILFGVVISAIFIAPLGFISNLNGLIFMILLISSGSAMIEPLINARITDIIPKENYGEYSGAFEAAKIIGCVTGPILTGFIVELAGFEYAFFPSAILFLVLLLPSVKRWKKG